MSRDVARYGTAYPDGASVESTTAANDAAAAANTAAARAGAAADEVELKIPDLEAKRLDAEHHAQQTTAFLDSEGEPYAKGARGWSQDAELAKSGAEAAKGGAETAKAGAEAARTQAAASEAAAQQAASVVGLGMADGKVGTHAALPAPTGARGLYAVVDEGAIYEDTGAAWTFRGVLAQQSVSSVEAAASRHGGPGAVLQIEGKRGGTFDWQATGTVDDGIIFDAANGVWVRRTKGVITLQDYGVVGDGVYDDTAALQAAFDGAKNTDLLLTGDASLTVRITDTVDAQFCYNVKIESTIVVEQDALGVIAGGHASSTRPVDIYFAKVIHASDLSGSVESDYPVLRLVGIKNGHCEVQWAAYVQIYANYADPSQYSVAYSQFTWGRIIRLDLYGEPGGTSWINENNHYGGRFRHIFIGGGYVHNQNVFYKPCLEGSITKLEIERGANNRFIDIRSEGGPSIVFGKDTWHNVVVDLHVSNPWITTGAAIVDDGGYENFYINHVNTELTRFPVWRIGPESIYLTNAAEGDADVVRGADGLFYSPTAAGVVFDEILDLDVVGRRLELSSDTKTWRVSVWCYDENMTLIPAVEEDSSLDQPLVSVSGFVVFGDEYRTSSVSVSARILSALRTVRYLRVRIWYSENLVPFEWVALEAFRHRIKDSHRLEALSRQWAKPLMSDSPPLGVAPLGTQVIREGGGYWSLDYRHSTVLASSAPGGTKTVAVEDAGSAAVGDVIGIRRDALRTHWSVVTGISGGSVSFADSLPAAAADGSDVVLVRWTFSPGAAADISLSSTDVGTSYDQSEVQSIVDDLHALTDALRTGGILK